MKNQIAKAISVVGHPILTVPLFALFNAFRSLEGDIIYVTAGVTILATMVLGVYLFRLKTSGRISDFDASNQAERQHKVYLPIIVVLTITLILFYILQQPHEVLISSFFFLMLFVVGYLSNFLIKSSLHLGVMVYFGVTFLGNLPILGAILLFFCLPLAWSRLYLQRHSIQEIMVGSLLGATIGGLQLWFL